MTIGMHAPKVLSAVATCLMVGIILTGCSSSGGSSNVRESLDLTAGHCPRNLPANRSGAGDVYLRGNPGGPIVSLGPTDAEICFYQVRYGQPSRSHLLASNAMTRSTAASLAQYFDRLPRPNAEAVNCPSGSGTWSALFVFSYSHRPAEGAELGSCGEVGSMSGLRSRVGDHRARTPPAIFVTTIESAYLVGTPKASAAKVADALDRFAASV